MDLRDLTDLDLVDFIEFERLESQRRTGEFIALVFAMSKNPEAAERIARSALPKFLVSDEGSDTVDQMTEELRAASDTSFKMSPSGVLEITKHG